MNEPFSSWPSSPRSEPILRDIHGKLVALVEPGQETSADGRPLSSATRVVEWFRMRIDNWRSWTERYVPMPRRPGRSPNSKNYGEGYVPEANYTSQVFDLQAPGSLARIWLCGGDGHCYSPMQVLLNGVPTYLSSMPEQWFNPQTGRPAPVVQYDFHVGPSQRTSETFCAPSPLLGDTDTGMRGAHAVYLHNPENRPFDFCATGYIIPEDEYLPVQFQASGPQGQALGQAEGTFTHKSPPEPALISVPAAGAGVYKVEVDAARWYGWSEPAMGMVQGPSIPHGHRIHRRVIRFRPSSRAGVGTRTAR